jgi:hypothetical protein
VDLNRVALYATELDDAYIALLTLRSDDATVRVTDWGENVTSDGHEYMAQAFALMLPAAGEDAPPRARVRVDNASLTFVAAIRSVTDVLDAEVSIVAVSAPNQVELGPLEFECRVARYDGSAVDLDLTYEPILDMAVPHHLFTPGGFPGLFR